MDKEPKESKDSALSKMRNHSRKNEIVNTTDSEIAQQRVRLPGPAEKTKALARRTFGGKTNRFQVWNPENLDDDTESSPATAIG